ncbi:MAG: hypothetical protein KF744_15505, partial [Taibaiella sp.]|nr:hypothetical protein [Taibaiella sp.]
MKKGLLTLFVLLALAFSGAKAQTTATYNFSAFTSTYSSIASTGTVMGSGWWGDDKTQLSIGLGFTFSFCGTAYTQTSICTNGWASLSNSTSITWTNATGSIATNGWLMAYWDDLISHASSSYYQTTGTAPNRIFTMEWGDHTLYPNFGTTPAASFQMKLYETSNVIEYWYGSSAYSTSSATIGIANGASDYSTINGVGSSPTNTTGTFYTVSGSPATNQVYRWSPCPVTVNATPSAAVCPGGSVTLTGTTTGIGWSWSGPGGFTSTALSPVITPTASGSYVLVATNGTCTMNATALVTVNPLPAAPVITPSVTTVCNGASVSLTSSAAATWSSTLYLYSDAGLTTPYTGGTATTVYMHPDTVTVVTPITYTVTVTNGFGCTASSTATVTINPATAAITGPMTVCAGYNITLSSTTSGGTWSSSATGIGTVNSTTGVVTGITPGTTTIYYTVAGCSSVAVVTVTPTPTAITGINIACLGATTTLSSTPAGGTWSSSLPAIGSVDPSTGVVTGLTVGTTTITYDLGSGCYV